MVRYVTATYEPQDEDGNVTASIECRIHYLFTPGCRAQIYGPAELCYPGEPDQFELAFLEREIDGRWIRVDRPADWRASPEAMLNDALYDWAKGYIDEFCEYFSQNEADLAADEAEARAEARADYGH